MFGARFAIFFHIFLIVPMVLTLPFISGRISFGYFEWIFIYILVIPALIFHILTEKGTVSNFKTAINHKFSTLQKPEKTRPVIIFGKILLCIICFVTLYPIPFYLSLIMILIGLDYIKCTQKIPKEHTNLKKTFTFLVFSHFAILFATMYILFTSLFAGVFYPSIFFGLSILSLISLVISKQLIINTFNKTENSQIASHNQTKDTKFVYSRPAEANENTNRFIFTSIISGIFTGVIITIGLIGMVFFSFMNFGWSYGGNGCGGYNYNLQSAIKYNYLTDDIKNLKALQSKESLINNLANVSNTQKSFKNQFVGNLIYETEKNLNGNKEKQTCKEIILENYYIIENDKELIKTIERVEINRFAKIDEDFKKTSNSLGSSQYYSDEIVYSKMDQFDISYKNEISQKLQNTDSLSKFSNSISNKLYDQNKNETKAIFIVQTSLYFMWITIVLIILNVTRLVTKKNLPEKWRLNKFATVSLIFIFVFGVLPVIFIVVPWVYWTIR